MNQTTVRVKELYEFRVGWFFGKTVVDLATMCFEVVERFIAGLLFLGRLLYGFVHRHKQAGEVSEEICTRLIHCTTCSIRPGNNTHRECNQFQSTSELI